MKTILANLIYELTKHGFIHVAMEVSDILSELKENYTDDDEEVSEGSIVNIVGLRGDTKPEQPFGGFTVEPFFSDKGDPF